MHLRDLGDHGLPISAGQDRAVGLHPDIPEGSQPHCPHDPTDQAGGPAVGGIGANRMLEPFGGVGQIADVAGFADDNRFIDAPRHAAVAIDGLAGRRIEQEAHIVAALFIAVAVTRHLDPAMQDLGLGDHTVAIKRHGRTRIAQRQPPDQDHRGSRDQRHPAAKTDKQAEPAARRLAVVFADYLHFRPFPAPALHVT